MKITLEMLKEMDACEAQVELFARVFPDGAEFSQENWDKAVAAGLQVLWLECLMENRRARDVYAAAEKAADIVLLAGTREPEQAYAAANKLAQGKFIKPFQQLPPGNVERAAAYRLFCEENDAANEVRMAACKPFRDAYEETCRQVLFPLLQQQLGDPCEENTGRNVARRKGVRETG